MYFETEEIKDHIRCINNQDCLRIDYKRCTTLETTTVEYEQCMIKILNSANSGQGRRLSEATDMFCESHYNDKTIWTGDLSPQTEAYYERKYACNGAEKGKQFCQDLNNNLPDQTKDTLFKCYREHQVNFAKEMCDNTFPGDTEGGTKLKCYMLNNVPKDIEYCQLYQDNLATDPKDITCFDQIVPKTREVCDAAYVYANSKHKYKTCLSDAGFVTLDNNFCETEYKEVSQAKDRWKCYGVLGLTADSLANRQMAEQAFADFYDSTPKYDYMKNVMRLDLSSLGPEYCHSTFYRQSQIEQKYACMEQQGIIRNSNQCVEQFAVYKDQTAMDTCMQGFKIPLTSEGCGVAKDCQAYCKALPVEDKYNCLDKFGYNRKADYCINMESYTLPQYNYREKNKYQCLTSSQGPYPAVHVSDEAYSCLNLYNDYLIERCLEQYEAIYGPTNLGFIGGQFAIYENLTQPLAVIQEQSNALGSGDLGGSPSAGGGTPASSGSTNPGNSGARIGGGAGSPTGSVSGISYGPGGSLIIAGLESSGGGTTDITDQQVIDFITTEISTVYNTNTFFKEETESRSTRLIHKIFNYQSEADKNEDLSNLLDVETSPIILNLDANAFINGSQTILHFYFDQLDPTKLDIEQDKYEEIDVIMKRSDPNTDHIKNRFTKAVEYLRILKTEMYLRQQDYALSKQVMPVIESNDQYWDFVWDMGTMFIFNSAKYMIWENKTSIELPIIYSTSVHHIHQDKALNRKLFGFPIKFEDKQAHQLQFEKIEHGEQEMQVAPGLVSDLQIHMKFIEDMYYYEYYNILHFLAESGGVMFLVFLFIVLPLILLFYLIRYCMVLKAIRDENERMAVKLHQDSLIQQLGKYKELFDRSRYYKEGGSEETEMDLYEGGNQAVVVISKSVDAGHNHNFQVSEKQLIYDEQYRKDAKYYGLWEVSHKQGKLDEKETRAMEKKVEEYDRKYKNDLLDDHDHVGLNHQIQHLHDEKYQRDIVNYRTNMNNVDRSRELNDNLSYYGQYQTRQKLDITDRNVEDLRLRTQKICYRINSAIQHNHLAFEQKLKDGQNCCDERNKYFEDEIGALKREIEQIRSDMPDKMVSQENIRMPLMMHCGAPPSTYDNNNAEYQEQIDALTKKVEFLLEQNYLKDELLIQLDEKIDKNDGNQFEPANTVIIKSARRLQAPNNDDDRLKDIIKKQEEQDKQLDDIVEKLNESVRGLNDTNGQLDSTNLRLNQTKDRLEGAINSLGQTNQRVDDLDEAIKNLKYDQSVSQAGSKREFTTARVGYDDSHILRELEHLRDQFQKQIQDLIKRFKDDQREKGDQVARIQNQLEGIKKNVSQIGNFDDIYDKIDDVDLFAKQSQKDIDYLMEVTQPEETQKLCENEFYRLFQTEFKNIFQNGKSKMYEQELNQYNKEAQNIINENLLISDKFKRRFEEFNDYQRQRLKKVSKKERSHRIRKPQIQKIRNNNFQQVYQHYQTHKQKYLAKLADFQVQQEKILSSRPILLPQALNEDTSGEMEISANYPRQMFSPTFVQSPQENEFSGHTRSNSVIQPQQLSYVQGFVNREKSQSPQQQNYMQSFVIRNPSQSFFKRPERPERPRAQTSTNKEVAARQSYRDRIRSVDSYSNVAPRFFKKHKNSLSYTNDEKRLQYDPWYAMRYGTAMGGQGVSGCKDCETENSGGKNRAVNKSQEYDNSSKRNRSWNKF